MPLSTRLELVKEGIQNCQAATVKAAKLQTHSDPAVKELANAIHFLSFGVQQIGLAIADEGRSDDLPIQRGR
ncbi:hypothetical protein ACWIGW_44275 [Nocardia brasiliensis]|uniref:hypothetical protein n=1 Tax=Streptomyces sp. NPDC056056 TaxID=3345698 RepID=UPI0035D70157